MGKFSKSCNRGFSCCSLPESNEIRTFGSFQKNLKVMLAEKIRKSILAFYFSNAFCYLLKIIILGKINSVVYIYFSL